MDSIRFDKLTRSLGDGTTRRGILGLLGGLAAAPLAADARSRHRKPSAEGPCGDGSTQANRCKRHSQCCTGFCKDGKCRGVELGSKCNVTRKCRGDAVCVKGVCTRRNGPGPNPGPGPGPGPTPASCTPQNCASGCCNGATCVPYANQGPTLCGAAGAACAACANGEICNAGACGVACDATSCANGCCSDAVTCVDPSDTPQACGANAGVCAVCTTGEGCCSGACATLSWGLEDITSGIANPKSVAFSDDGLSLYIASADPNNTLTRGLISIYTRATTNDPWTHDQDLGVDDPDMAGVDFVTVTMLGDTVATMSSVLACGVVWKKANGAWTKSGTIGSCGNVGSTDNLLSGPRAVWMHYMGSTAYVADTGNGRISIWTYANSTWSFDSSWGGGAGACGSSASGTTQTCPKSIAVTADETDIYVVSGATGHSMQRIYRSSSSNAWSSATGAWTGPAVSAPNGGLGCSWDRFGLTFYCPDGQTVQKAQAFATAWTDVTPTPAPGANAVGMAITNPQSSPVSYAYAEDSSGVQVSGNVCP